MMLHPLMASALASEHRRDMITQASKVALGSEAGRASQDTRRDVLLPRYRVSWSRTTLSPAGVDGHDRSWVIVISATRGG